jgi:hypothetical protein
MNNPQSLGSNFTHVCVSIIHAHYTEGLVFPTDWANVPHLSILVVVQLHSLLDLGHRHVAIAVSVHLLKRCPGLRLLRCFFPGGLLLFPFLLMFLLGQSLWFLRCLLLSPQSIYLLLQPLLLSLQPIQTGNLVLSLDHPQHTIVRAEERERE